MADEDLSVVIDEARSGMEATIERFRSQLQRVRTGRASTGLVESLKVNCYGTATPLNQIANISVPDPRTVAISPYDPTVLPDIEKAVLASDLGISPANDGKVVRLAIPPLTEERRKDLVKQVKKIAEEHKVRIREARRDANAMLKQMESDGELPKDDRRRAEKDVQDLTDEFIKKADDTSSQKEKEILQV